MKLACLSAMLCLGRLFAAASGATTVIDSAGNVWRTGETNLFQPSATAFQKTAVNTVCATENLSPFIGTVPVYCMHAFLSKQDGSGSVLYATWLGGSSQDGATAIATDAQGNVYVAGYTYSVDFPVTAGVVQSKNAGPVTPTIHLYDEGPYGPTYVLRGGDAFVAKFTPDGTLAYSTLLGGSGADIPTLISVDAAGSVYISGTTTSSDFPLTAGGNLRQPGGYFFARLSAGGRTLSYASYYESSILAFDVDGQGIAYLTGDFAPPPSTVASGPYVTILDTVAGMVRSSVFLPANAPKIAGAGLAIAVAPDRSVYLAISLAPPLMTGAAQLPPFRPMGAGYLLKLAADANRIVSETDLTQVRLDSLLLDSAGSTYAFGQGSGPIPATPLSLLVTPCSTDGGAFVLQTNSAGRTMAATYFREGDDTAVSVVSPGHILQYRARSATTAPLDLTQSPTINFGCPENLAAVTGLRAIAPGEIFVLTGSGLGPAKGSAGAPDASGSYPTLLAGVQVLFNGQPVPLLFVQANEIHGVSPFALADFPVIQVVNGTGSAPPLEVQRSTVNPAIFSANGQGAIVNQDGTVNTPANPALLGSMISVYATGTGALMNAARSIRNPIPDGQVTPIPPPFVVSELAYPELRFAGVAGATLWSGSAPGVIAGVTQINVQLPAALAAGAVGGAVPVILNAAGAFSPPVMISLKQ